MPADNVSMISIEPEQKSDDSRKAKEVIHLLQKTKIVLRQNWPITITFVFLLLFVITYITPQHWYEIFATRYWPTKGENVDYWGIVRHSQAVYIFILPPTIWIAIFVANLIWIFRNNTTCLQCFTAISLLIISAISVFLLSFSILVAASLIDGTRLNHLETTRYNESVYHLARGDTTAGGWDVFFSRYLVYECASSDSECHLIHDYEIDCSYTSNCETVITAHLRVAEGKLYLEVDQEKVLLITS